MPRQERQTPIVEGKEWNACVAKGWVDASSVKMNQPSAALNYLNERLSESVEN